MINILVCTMFKSRMCGGVGAAAVRRASRAVLFLDGAPSAVPAVLHAALRRRRDAAPEHRPLRRRLQQSQGPGPHPEALPGQDPRLQQQEQVSLTPRFFQTTCLMKLCPFCTLV